MSTGQILLGIAAFALVTAVLYVWGLKRSMTRSADLEQILLSKSAGKVAHYLRSHDRIGLAEMARLCAGVRAGLFWSRQRAAVRDPEAFAPRLARYMVEQQLLEELPGGVYRLRP